jgi:general secretion pathway protein G
MKLAHARGSGRRGFTLIEMMVVIVIIGILLAMVAAAVVKGLGKSKETRNRSDVSQMELALEQFKQRFGAYPPSRIVLYDKYAFYFDATGNYKDGQLGKDSVAFLNRMFPRLASQNLTDYNYPWTYSQKANPSDPAPTSIWVDWNGNGALDDKGMYLEGDQCLVFFLGGIPAPCTATTGTANLPPSVLGFSTNPRNPAAATSDRIGPFFEFQTSRLVVTRPAAGPQNSRSFYSYLDGYGSSDGLGTSSGASKPYLYFSSGNSANNYNRYQSSDCSFWKSSDGVTSIWPYAELVTPTTPPTFPIARYQKPNTYQIISAGADGQFGTGSALNDQVVPGKLTLFPPWTPTTAASVYDQNNPGYDDQSNFTGSLLGVGADQ